MRKIQETSRNVAPASPGSKTTIGFMEKGARQNIFAMLLSIYLVLAALLSLIVVIRDKSSILPDSLKNTSFLLYAIAAVFVGISFLSNAEIRKNLGFITLAVFALLDGINDALYLFLGTYPIDLFPLLGALSLSSGIFFISQGEIWENKHIGFMLLSGYLIALSLAYFDGISHPLLIIAGIFALLAAVFFFRRK